MLAGHYCILCVASAVDLLLMILKAGWTGVHRDLAGGEGGGS
jgi:hypothetical protein